VEHARLIAAAGGGKFANRRTSLREPG
jgi:hypothetical protein